MCTLLVPFALVACPHLKGLVPQLPSLGVLESTQYKDDSPHHLLQRNRLGRLLFGHWRFTCRMFYLFNDTFNPDANI